MPTVRFTKTIQRHVDCPTRVVAGATLREVLDGYFALNQLARAYVLDDQGRLRQHMAAFIDGIHSACVDPRDSRHMLVGVSCGEPATAGAHGSLAGPSRWFEKET